MPFNGLLFAAASCLLLPTTTTAQALWYYPNGRQSADVPCNISAPVSMCCGSAKACLSNGLCVLDGTTEDSGISYACGTCTDAQWTSGVCPLRCLLNPDSPDNSSAYDFRSSGVQVWECDQRGYGKEADYCCESDSEKTRCCSTSAAVFKLPAATVGNALDQAFAATTSPSPGPSPSPASSGSSSGPDGMSGPAAAAHSTPSQTSSTGVADDSSPGPSVGAIVGIALGVGVAVGVGALAAVVFFHRRRGKRSMRAGVVGAEVTGEKGEGLGELGGRGVYEMDGLGMPAEVAGGDRARHEPGPSVREDGSATR